METNEILQCLNNVKEKTETKKYCTGELNVHDMVCDIIPKIEKLSKLEAMEEVIGCPLFDFVEYFMDKTINAIVKEVKNHANKNR